MKYLRTLILRFLFTIFFAWNLPVDTRYLVKYQYYEIPKGSETIDLEICLQMLLKCTGKMHASHSVMPTGKNQTLYSHFLDLPQNWIELNYGIPSAVKAVGSDWKVLHEHIFLQAFERQILTNMWLHWWSKIYWNVKKVLQRFTKGCGGLQCSSNLYNTNILITSSLVLLWQFFKITNGEIPCCWLQLLWNCASKCCESWSHLRILMPAVMYEWIPKNMRKVCLLIVYHTW